MQFSGFEWSRQCVRFRIPQAGLVLCIFWMGTVSARPLPAQQWPTWHGPQGQGVVSESGAPVEWDSNTNVKWRVDLPGPGNSSPIVFGERLWITQFDKESNQRQLRCYDADSGKLLWVQGVACDEDEATHPTNPYCAASPVTNGKYVLAFFGAGGLCCYDLDGQLVWRKELGVPQHLFGQGASPLIHGEWVTVNFGPGTEQFWVTLNLESGEEKWRLKIDQVDAPNPFDEPGGPKLPPDAKLRDPFGTWATPFLARDSRRTALILAFPEELRAVEPETGETLWSCRGLGNQVFASPIQVDDKIVCLGSKAMAVRMAGTGDVTDSQRVWYDAEDRARIGTGIVLDGVVLANTMQGIVEAIDANTGKRIWQERLANAAGGGSWSSLVGTGDRVYSTNKDGTVFVFRASPEFELLSKNELNESTNATPALANNCIYIRTDKSIWCLGS